mgnify:CR=1 FL=1
MKDNYSDEAYRRAAIHLLGSSEDHKEKKITKQQAIDEALWNLVIHTYPREPGEAYKAFPQELKDVLEQCDSKDWNRRIK